MALGPALVGGPARGAQSPPEIVGPYEAIPFRASFRTSAPAPTSPTPAPTRSASSSTRRTRTSPSSASSSSSPRSRPGSRPPHQVLLLPARPLDWVDRPGSAPELYHWDGDYWFDIARGRRRRQRAQPADRRRAERRDPVRPRAYRPFFDPDGGGGVMVELETEPGPDCTSKVDTPEERDLVYGDTPAFLGCIEPGGELRGKRVGRVRSGWPRPGPRPARASHEHRAGIDRWCLIGKGSSGSPTGTSAPSRPSPRAAATRSTVSAAGRPRACALCGASRSPSGGARGAAERCSSSGAPAIGGSRSGSAGTACAG